MKRIAAVVVLTALLSLVLIAYAPEASGAPAAPPSLSKPDVPQS
ncbi:hypothetical protein [Streptomyces sp. NPDC059949]